MFGTARSSAGSLQWSNLSGAAWTPVQGALRPTVHQSFEMEVRLISSIDKASWNRYIDRTPLAIAWQAYEWSEVVARHYNYRYFPFAACEGEEIVGVLPIYLGGAGKRPALISIPYAVAGGIVADSPAAEQALLQRAIQLSAEVGGAPITLKQYKHKVAGDLGADEHFYNRELSLSPDTDRLRGQIERRNLEVAAQAAKLGLEVEYPARDLAGFYHLLLRHHRAQGIPCVGEGWIKTLLDFGMYSVALAWLNGVPVAGTMVKEFKKTVSLPFSCLAPGHASAEVAMYGLYWNLIQSFAERGFQIFHSGRIPHNDQAPAYRLGWGGTKYNYCYQYYPNQGVRTEFATKRGWKRRLVSRVWRLLPLPIARMLGPVVVRRFP
jgi:hypothetical protein